MAEQGPLLLKISSDLQKAMKEKAEERLSVLRMLKSKILYVNARGELSDAEIIKIISKYAKELAESIEEANKFNRPEAAEKSNSELKIAMEYLPKQLTPDEIKAAVGQAAKDLNAASIKDMGNVMKAVLAKHPGVDGKLVNQFVREILK